MRHLILIIFTFPSFVYSITCSEEPALKRLYRLDNRNGPLFKQKVTNQGEMDNCYAHTASIIYKTARPNTPRLNPHALSSCGTNYSMFGGKTDIVLKCNNNRKICPLKTFNQESREYREARLVEILRKLKSTKDSRISTQIKQGISQLAHQLGKGKLPSKLNARRLCEQDLNYLNKFVNIPNPKFGK